jgi:prolyl-tRNA synthetase
MPWGNKERGRLVLALVRGDLEINETKLLNALGGGRLRAAEDGEIRASGAVPGYASAVGLAVANGLEAHGTIVVGDTSLKAGGNFVAGANLAGFHFRGANYPRDFMLTSLVDIAQADAGHQCAVCNGRLSTRRAIEAGHCFKLGARFSEAVNAVFLDRDGKPRPIVMGSYGIGLDRLMALIVEQHHDADGIIWPDAVAPYRLHLMHVGKEVEAREAAGRLYQMFCDTGLEVLYDDRDLSAGVKFKDADLIGIPWRIAVGARNLAEGLVEVKRRDAGERQRVPLDDLPVFLKKTLSG